MRHKIGDPSPYNSLDPHYYYYVPASPPAPPFAASYGGTGADAATAMQLTHDGGYIVAGNTTSFGASGNDLWLLKLGRNGDIPFANLSTHTAGGWQRRVGGNNNDYATAVLQTDDYGYVVAGYTNSFGASDDGWLLKVDAFGNFSSSHWSTTYGSSKNDRLFALSKWSNHTTIAGVETYADGYLAAGSTLVTNNGYEMLVLKVDEEGNIGPTFTWQKAYGGTANEIAHAIQQVDTDGSSQTNDGSIVVGRILDGTNNDIGILKLKNDGAVEWQKRIGGTASQDYAYAVQHHLTFPNITTPHSWYTVAGYTNWTSGVGGYDAWVAKLDANGNIGEAGTWQKTYGSAGDDYAKALIRTGDGGYVVVGYTNWTGGGGEDAWIAKLDTDGNLGPSFPNTWQKIYGGPNNDQAAAVQETPNGRIVVAGFTDSFGDAGREFFVLNLDAQGELNACSIGASSNLEINSSSLTVRNASLPAGFSSMTMASPVPSLGTTTSAPAYHCDLPATPTRTPTPTPTPTRTPTPTPTPTPDYCASASEGVGNEWISRVQLNTGDHSSSYSAYTKVPGIFTTVQRGAAYTLAVTGSVYNPGGYTWIEHVNAWIDFNGDRDFADAGETITVGSHTFTATGSYCYTQTIPVPAASAVGETRMRIILRYGNPPAACGSYDFGETEDYTMTIAP